MLTDTYLLERMLLALSQRRDAFEEYRQAILQSSNEVVPPWVSAPTDEGIPDNRVVYAHEALIRALHRAHVMLLLYAAALSQEDADFQKDLLELVGVSQSAADSGLVLTETHASSPHQRTRRILAALNFFLTAWDVRSVPMEFEWFLSEVEPVPEPSVVRSRYDRLRE